MKPEQLAELRTALLTELYRVQPLGRPVDTLHKLVRRKVACAPADVAAQIAFLQGRNFVRFERADHLSPGLAPFWFITSDGMAHCEENHLV